MMQFKPTHFLFNDQRLAWLWLPIRVYVGFVWLMAGWEKLFKPVWIGEQAGVAVTGFLNGALQKTVGDHPDVQSWYAWLIQNIGLPNATLFSYLVTFGEILIGALLIVGALTAVASFFGLVMNFSYLLAGAVSVNPQLVILQLLLLLAWRTSGYIGLDRWLYKYLRIGSYFMVEPQEKPKEQS